MMFRFLLFVSFWCVMSISGEVSDGNGTKYSPLVLVPGDGGSRIYARSMVNHWLCFIGRKWSLIWLELKLWLPFMEHCLKTYFRLYYNETSHRTYDHPSIQTRVQDWGTTTSIDYIGTYHLGFDTIYGPLSSKLVENGYVRNVSLRGAPFDFRRAPNDNIHYFKELAELVEDTYHCNGNSSVMLMAHSMGNLYMNFFLSKQPSAWKKKFVRGFIAVSAPVGGAVKSVLAETAGIRFNELIVNMGAVRTVLRSMPSTVFNFPSPLFWAADEVLARRPGRNYTVADYRRLLDEVNFPDGWRMYQDTARLADPLWAPDLAEVHCLHGVGLDTPAVLEWASDGDFPDSQPDVKYGPGDGTVNLRSLHGCLRWPGVQHRTYPGAEHKKILGDRRFLADVLRILRL